MVRKVVKDNINPSYYKKKIQVTDFIIEYEMNFLEGNIIKYVCRHKAKNGLEDLTSLVYINTNIIIKKKISNLKLG